jgi:hypothetical protein
MGDQIGTALSAQRRDHSPVDVSDAVFLRQPSR